MAKGEQEGILGKAEFCAPSPGTGWHSQFLFLPSSAWEKLEPLSRVGAGAAGST